MSRYDDEDRIDRRRKPLGNTCGKCVVCPGRGVKRFHCIINGVRAPGMSACEFFVSHAEVIATPTRSRQSD